MAQYPNEFTISPSLVSQLVHDQFPQWDVFSINPVEPGGWDHRTYRLGNTMAIRLPSSRIYEAQVSKEFTWLPILAPLLSCKIPQPIALGRPTQAYPAPWGVYSWQPGIDAHLCIDLDLKKLAVDLAHFLKELHAINPLGGPVPGPHNFYRAGHPSVYDEETRSALALLPSVIDTQKALTIWEHALSSHWHKDPVWIHGDLSASNILIQNTQLSAIIDFGGMAIGDPACDLVIAWTLFDDESRAIFRSLLTLDKNTWARARGWALWKALITLTHDIQAPSAQKQLQIISSIMQEAALP